MIRPIRAKGLSVLAIATIALFLISFLIKGSPKAVSGVVLWAGLQSMVAFYGLLWALPRSNQAFFSVFVVDALIRMVSLGVITFFLYHFRIPFTIPLVSLAVVYLFLSLLQIPFFYEAA